MTNFSKKTIKINESFQCEYCQALNPIAEQTCRNHCFQCLYSKHVDQSLPGDRASKCHGLMEPIKINYNGKKKFQILHQCLKCEKTIFNKILNDDNIDQIAKIMSKQNLKFHE